MKTPKRPSPNRPTIAQVRGAVLLATDATVGVSRISEGVHQSVLLTLGQKQIGGLTSLIYKAVEGVAKAVGGGVEKALTVLESVIGKSTDPRDSFEKDAVLAALNGVMGDRLEANQNPLRTQMTLRYKTGASQGPKLLLVIHGLCMNDSQWNLRNVEGNPIDGHAEKLEKDLGYTPVFLKYNTGCSIQSNAQTLSEKLDDLVEKWPIAIEEISVLAHSMGGLLVRRACEHVKSSPGRWRSLLKRIVFLGTPHFGAPLEQAGQWIDLLLGSNRFSAPFTRLTKLRSQGINDLRLGFDAALPDGVACFAIAATIAAKRSKVAERLTGDGLVPLNSALGIHASGIRAGANKNLAFDASSQCVLYRTNHMELLHASAVTEQVSLWLALPLR
jgi:pimeloyl-ACP methyl ester carboxylesterase